MTLLPDTARYVPLSFADHAALRVVPRPGFRAMAQAGLLPVRLAELSHLVGEAPLVIRQRPDATEGAPPAFDLLGVYGTTPDRNLRIDPKGRWLGAYVPAILRQSPFRLGPEKADGTPPDMEIDLDSDCVTRGEGLPLFDAEGGESAHVKKVREFLQTLRSNAAETNRACQALAEAGVLARIELPKGALRDLDPPLLGVDRRRLEALDGETLARLAPTGALLLAYGHFLSAGASRLLTALLKQHEAAARKAAPKPDLDAALDSLTRQAPAAAATTRPPAEEVEMPFAVGQDDRFDLDAWAPTPRPDTQPETDDDGKG